MPGSQAPNRLTADPFSSVTIDLCRSAKILGLTYNLAPALLHRSTKRPNRDVPLFIIILRHLHRDLSADHCQPVPDPAYQLKVPEICRTS